MNIDVAVRRAQVYRLLADAFLYPSENWLEDLPALEPILRDLDAGDLRLATSDLALADLQAEHRRAFGLTGSLCYETEFGLPHEFRQSQELADIAGFYRAFGFNIGGKVRERPDHIAVELEFMHALALKEAYAAQTGFVEATGLCTDAQRKFLQDHLGRWIGLFAEALALSAAGEPVLSAPEPRSVSKDEGPYPALARFAAAFVRADVERLGAHPELQALAGITPTPLGAEISCEGCPAVE